MSDADGLPGCYVTQFMPSSFSRRPSGGSKMNSIGDSQMNDVAKGLASPFLLLIALSEGHSQGHYKHQAVFDK